MEGDQPVADERLEKEEVQRLVSEAMRKKSFPPVIQFPEASRQDGLLSSLFRWPVVVWVPDGCSCTPRVKEYKQRTVEDVESKCLLLYVKYQCTGSTKGWFSTVTSDYLQREARVLMQFPFVMTKKFGLSKSLMELVHEGMTSPHGLSSTLENIKRRREKRYYKLLCLFADRVGQLQLTNQSYIAPLPPSVGHYSSKQKPVGAEILSAAWLQSTTMYSAICEQVMSTMKVKKALRVDHSVKFCKKLKVWSGGTGKRESIADTKMLLLLQNEIGQIVGRRLTRSENHDETRELLQYVKGAFPSGDDESECYVVSDNANAVRNLVTGVFGSSVGVRQDPFHVIQRFTEKVKNKQKKKALSRELHDALYAVDGALRPPDTMVERFECALAAVDSTDISCTQSEWAGCVSSNLAQIQRGGLYVGNNFFEEGGGKTVRIVSTSQLEGFHSALKKILARSVSAEIGLRILDIFILRHNLKVGVRYGRNPPLQHADILSLCQTAILCRGVVAESPQLEFVSQLMSMPLQRPTYRSVTNRDYGFEQWRQMFETAHVDTVALEANRQAPEGDLL